MNYNFKVTNKCYKTYRPKLIIKQTNLKEKL